MTNDEAHRLAREEGLSAPPCRLAKLVLVPFPRPYLGPRIEGAERIPATGAAISAPNDKRLWDPLRVAVATQQNGRRR